MPLKLSESECAICSLPGPWLVQGVRRGLFHYIKMESQFKCHLFRATSRTPVLDYSICLASFVALVKSWCCRLAGLLVCVLLISSPSTNTEKLGDLPKATQLEEAM